MFQDLQVLANGTWYTVSGADLLYLLNEKTKTIFGSTSAPDGAGDQRDPFTMSAAAQWRWVGRQSEATHDRWYRIGGRIIRKNGAGPKPNYTMDEGLAAAPGDLSRAYGPRGGPSYREYASAIRGMEQQQVPETLSAHTLTRQMRQIMEGKAPPPPPWGQVDRPQPWQVLPVLAATMFISETIRNNRSFAINLMLLDLVESRATYGLSHKTFTLSRLLWHPQEPEQGFHNNPTRLPKPKQNLYGDKYADTVGELNKLGGKGAMTQTDAVKQSKARVEKSDNGAPLTLAHQKEASILIHWLVSRPGLWVGTHARHQLPASQPERVYLPSNFVTTTPSKKATDKLGKDGPVLADRIRKIHVYLDERLNGLGHLH